MISLALVAAFAFQSGNDVTLVRGGVARGVALWDYADTTLDAKAGNEALGSEAVLVGGSGHTILLRFGDIDRVVKPGQRVKRARLVFTQTGGDKATLASAARLLGAWGEGPYQTIGGIVTKPPETKGLDLKKPAEPPAPRGAATWRFRQAGEPGLLWQQPGAAAPGDAAKLEGVKLGSDGKEVWIDGLEATVQDMADHPFANFGWALFFDSSVEFASGQNTAGRPRLELEVEDGSVSKGPDLSVVRIERQGSGEGTTFVAHIKNVGDAVADGGSATWYLDDRAGVPQALTAKLAPGQETTLSTTYRVRTDSGDHRFGSVALRLQPAAGDANPRNDGLTVPAQGKPLVVTVSPAAVQAMAPQSPEEWVQSVVREFNDVYLGQSRYSFAPDGARERVIVERVAVGSAEPISAGETPVVVEDGKRQTLLRNLALAVGAPDLRAESVSADQNALDGRGGRDRFPGIVGYGDTRFEGLYHGSIWLPYEPYPDPQVDPFPPEATGLLSATDVASINAGLGGPALALPKTALLLVKSQGQEPLGNAQIEVFQTQDGKIAADAKPKMTLKTNERGSVLLPLGETGAFGMLDPKGGNGALLLRTTVNGVTGSTWLKAWQLADYASRGNPSAAIVPIRFAVPTLPLETETNLAADRIVSDSANSLPAKLAALIDGDSATSASLGQKPGDWVEIDLGRDRTVGEVELTAMPNGFWTKYDIVTYSTGQRPEEGQLWMREVDARWTFENRRSPQSGGTASVAYLGKPLRFRYIRIVNRGAAPGTLAEIRVVPAKIAG